MVEGDWACFVSVSVPGFVGQKVAKRARKEQGWTAFSSEELHVSLS
jgi:hypothetical protein